MRTEASTVKNSIGRLILAFLSFLMQILWFVTMSIWLNSYSTALTMVFTIVAITVVMRIYCGQGNAAFKLPWIIMISCVGNLPLFDVWT